MFTPIDISIIIYLVGMVICFYIAREHLAKSELYRNILALALACIWPIPAFLCIMLAIEAVIDWLKEEIGDGY